LDKWHNNKELLKHFRVTTDFQCCTGIGICVGVWTARGQWRVTVVTEQLCNSSSGSDRCTV